MPPPPGSATGWGTEKDIGADSGYTDRGCILYITHPTGMNSYVLDSLNYIR